MNFSRSIYSGGNSKSSLELIPAVEIGGKRSFAKVMLSTDKAHPLTSPGMDLKPPTKEAEPLLALKGRSVFPTMHAPKEQLKLTEPDGSNVASENGES
ncbi:hypothetical protein SLA2020_407040 [Shorea laevis]